MKGQHLLWQFLVMILVLVASDSVNAGEVPTFAYHNYEKYKTAAHFRAFVVTSTWKRYGVTAWSLNQPSIEGAVDKALNQCKKTAVEGAYAATSFDCKLLLIGNIRVLGMNDEELETAKKLYKSKPNATNKDLAGFSSVESSPALADVESTDPNRKVVALGLTLTQLVERAEHSNVAKFELGKAFEDGRVPPKALMFAQQWYMKAAKGGHKMAQYKIGWMYQEGLGGLPKDVAQAAYWYRQATPISGAADALARLKTDFETATETALLTPSEQTDIPITENEILGSTELGKNIKKYYDKHPIERSRYYGYAFDFGDITEIIVVNISGNRARLDMRYTVNGGGFSGSTIGNHSRAIVTVEKFGPTIRVTDLQPWRGD